MRAALAQFQNNFVHVRNLGHLYSALRNQTTPAVELEDILRAELVMAVSALDHYIHEVVRHFMLEMCNGVLQKTSAYGYFQLSLDAAHAGISNPGSSQWLEDEIRLRHGWQSFQHPDRLADGLRLITDSNIWEEISSLTDISVSDLKNELEVIVDRRNKIAHEADVNPASPGTRWPIDLAMVTRAADYLEFIVEHVHTVLSVHRILLQLTLL